VFDSPNSRSQGDKQRNFSLYECCLTINDYVHNLLLRCFIVHSQSLQLVTVTSVTRPILLGEVKVDSTGLRLILPATTVHHDGSTTPADRRGTTKSHDLDVDSKGDSSNDAEPSRLTLVVS